MTIEADTIVEAFGRAAIGMQSWHDALMLVSDATRSRIAQIAVVDRGAMMLNLLSGTSPDEESAYFAARGPDPTINIRSHGVLMAPLLKSIVDTDFATAQMLDRSDIYRGLFRDCDVPHSLQIRSETASGMTMAICLQRPGSSGVATASDRRLLELLAPAVTSAIDASMALGRGIDQQLIRTAEDLAGPAVLLGADLDVISLSAAAEAALRRSSLLAVKHGRLVATDRRGQVALDQAFRGVAFGPIELRLTRRVLFAGRDGETLPVDLCPLPTRASGPLSAARALLVVRLSSAAEASPLRHEVARTFALTMAEADVAVGLAEGLAVTEIARRRGSSVGTVRSQLKAIFEKTGWRRQTELILALRAFTAR